MRCRTLGYAWNADFSGTREWIVAESGVVNSLAHDGDEFGSDGLSFFVVVVVIVVVVGFTCCSNIMLQQ